LSVALLSHGSELPPGSTRELPNTTTVERTPQVFSRSSTLENSSRKRTARIESL